MRTLLLVLALVVAAAPAQAAPITYEWSGTVNPGGVYPMVTPAGAPISFDLTYDVDQSNPCAEGRGLFSISARMHLLGNTYNTFGGGIEVNNPLGNLCLVPIPGFVPGTSSGYEIRLAFSGVFPIDYTDPGGPKIFMMFPLVVLTLGAPFDGTLHALGESRDAFLTAYDQGPRTLFSGKVSYRPVPEPGLLALIALGVAGLGWRRMRAARN